MGYDNIISTKSTAEILKQAQLGKICKQSDNQAGFKQSPMLQTIDLKEKIKAMC